MIKNRDLLWAVFIFYIISGYFYGKQMDFSYDEPHYLLNSYSLMYDFDFDLKNNFLNQDYLTFYNGTLDSFIHISRNSIGEHWYSVHSYGLSILLMPFLYVGIFFDNIKFFIYLFNSLIFILSLYFLMRTFELNFLKPRKYVYLVSLLFCSLPVLVFTKFLAVENIAFLYVAFTIFFYYKITKDTFSYFQLLFFVLFSVFLIFVHVKFLILSLLSISLIVFAIYRIKGIKNKYIVTSVIVYGFGLLLILFFLYTLYGKFSFTAQYESGAMSIKYIIQGILGQFFDSQVGIFIFTPVLFLSLFGFKYIFKNNIDKVFIFYSLFSVLSSVILSAVHVLKLESFQKLSKTNMDLFLLSLQNNDSNLLPMWFQSPLSRFILPIVPILIFFSIITLVKQKKFINYILILIGLILSFIIIFIIPNSLYRGAGNIEAFSPIISYLSSFLTNGKFDLNIFLPNIISNDLIFYNLIQVLGIVIIFIFMYYPVNKKNIILFIVGITLVIFSSYSKFDDVNGFKTKYYFDSFFWDKDAYNIKEKKIYKSENATTKILSYGPYKFLPVGEYKVIFNVDYNFFKNSKLHFDIFSKTQKVLKTFTSDGIFINYDGKVSVSNKEEALIFINNTPQYNVEFRIFLENFIGNVTFESISIERINN